MHASEYKMRLVAVLLVLPLAAAQCGSSCAADAECIEVGDGSPYCACRPGFTGDGVVECVDIDECAVGQQDCEPNMDCIDLEGTYACACSRGYACDQATVDTCAMQSLDRAVCHCPAGLSGPPPLCADLDECALGVHTCEHRCVNTVGSFDCACNAGYARRGAGTCVERMVSPLPLVVCVCAALVIFMVAMGV